MRPQGVSQRRERLDGQSAGFALERYGTAANGGAGVTGAAARTLMKDRRAPAYFKEERFHSIRAKRPLPCNRSVRRDLVPGMKPSPVKPIRSSRERTFLAPSSSVRRPHRRWHVLVRRLEHALAAAPPAPRAVRQRPPGQPRRPDDLPRFTCRWRAA